MSVLLKQTIKEEAHRLGFSLAGVTTPEPPPHWLVFERWLAEGRHASMAYLADKSSRQRRADPRRILPECRSILVLGIRYSVPRPDPSPLGRGAGGEGKIASYAWGDDYHLVLPERLRRLVAFIEAQVGHPIPNRCYTDSGPILERDLAQRAGLGWIAKNTCLIAPRLGSYFLLAEILLGVELAPDPPFTEDRCGRCKRCIEACPTHCILPDRTLDGHRCISYLTIEQKGDIPPDLRPFIGNWIFGCDICQMVCPWNRFAEPVGDAAFAPRAGVLSSNLIEELALTPEAFNRKFKDNPVKRAKRGGYLRNVAVALGNDGDPAATAALERALHDPNPLVRSHAAWALGRIQGK